MQRTFNRAIFMHLKNLAKLEIISSVLIAIMPLVTTFMRFSMLSKKNIFDKQPSGVTIAPRQRLNCQSDVPVEVMVSNISERPLV
jgi:hypothetical protein